MCGNSRSKEWRKETLWTPQTYSDLEVEFTEGELTDIKDLVSQIAIRDDSS
jgi:hypothetical protein